MSYCRACRPIEKGDYDNPEAHFGTCQECGHTHRVIQQGYYGNIPQKEIKDGIIILDDKFATEIGFTCDKFEGYLWKKENYIYISLIKSLNPGHGDLSTLFNSILEKGFGIKVPATLPRMESICKRKGFRLTTDHHKDYNETVDVWVLEQPK